MTDTTAQQLGEITYVRVYEAPRDLVYRCMTTPEDLQHFWGPKGSSTPLANITVDLRPGGEFVTVMVDDATGNEMPMRGVFVEVNPPETLAWSEKGDRESMMTSLTFRDLGDGRTEVTAHQTNIPMMFLSPEAQAGMQSSFDRFVEYLATLR